jgi:hypothetical protein
MYAAHNTTTLVATLPRVDEATAASLFDGKFGIHEIEEMYLSYLADIVSQLTRYQKTRVCVLYYSSSLQEVLLQLFRTPAELRLVGQKETGSIYSPTIERLFKSGQSKSVLLLLTLHPLVNYHILGHALRILSFEDESVVIGTLSNQTPYLLGMKNPHGSFLTLSDSEYYDSEALLRRCCSIDALVNPLNSLPAIQTMGDLLVLREKLERLCEQRHDYPKRTLSLLRQFNNPHMTVGSA